MEWYRPAPPPAEFDWSERDNLNYNETGALAALDFAARNSKEMLRNFYKKGWDSWRKGLDEASLRLSHPGRSGRSQTRC